MPVYKLQGKCKCDKGYQGKACLTCKKGYLTSRGEDGTSTCTKPSKVKKAAKGAKALAPAKEAEEATDGEDGEDKALKPEAAAKETATPNAAAKETEVEAAQEWEQEANNTRPHAVKDEL